MISSTASMVTNHWWRTICCDGAQFFTRISGSSCGESWSLSARPGRRPEGWQAGSRHWEVGRLLLDSIDRPRVPTRMRCCGIARSRISFPRRQSCTGRTPFERAREVFPQSRTFFSTAGICIRSCRHRQCKPRCSSYARRRQRNGQLSNGRTAARRTIPSRRPGARAGQR